MKRKNKYLSLNNVKQKKHLNNDLFHDYDENDQEDEEDQEEDDDESYEYIKVSEI